MYFCKKNDSISFRKENLCKDMKQVKKEKSWVAITTRVMKKATEVENTKSLISCWKMAQYIH